MWEPGVGQVPHVNGQFRLAAENLLHRRDFFFATQEQPLPASEPEFRVVFAGRRTAVACDWAALADGLQCATFLTLLGDPVTVLPILVLKQEIQVVLAAKHSSGRKAQHQYCHERPVMVTHGKSMPRRDP